MSNYLPRSQKKRERQERLENDLRRLIAKDADVRKLLAAAEDVRAARIRTVRAYRQHCWALGSTAQYDAKIAALQATPVEAILAEFGVRLGDRADSGETASGVDLAATEPPASAGDGE